MMNDVMNLVELTIYGEILCDSVWQNLVWQQNEIVPHDLQ